MTGNITINGLPRSIAMDGWWLTSDAETLAPEGRAPDRPDMFALSKRWGAGIGGLVFLILLGDFLFWGYHAGISLALFALAVFAVAALRHGEWRESRKPAILMGLSVLPVIEYVQPLSVGILLLGGVFALGWLRVIREGGFGWVAAAALQLVQYLPVSGVLALLGAMPDIRRYLAFGRSMAGVPSGTFRRNWAFPIGGALVLGTLLLSANPVLQGLVVDLFSLDLDVFAGVQRLVFWVGIGLLVWPLVNPPKPVHAASFALPDVGHKFGLNCGSVLRALLVFNGLLAVQSVLDFSILLGGADLPDGMRHATYAHRGAYPLLVTATLAGVFTFGARPFLSEHRLMKPLLLLWVAQNVALTLSAVLRLELYIGKYGLTFMRMYALIWMALVAVGLVMVLWHVMRERSQVVLLGRLSMLGFGTLYLCAFVNFSGLIATDIMARAADPAPVRSTIRSVDWNYLCRLGPTADKAIAEGKRAHPTIASVPRCRVSISSGAGRKNWRELDFRTIRTHDYLARWSY